MRRLIDRMRSKPHLQSPHPPVPPQQPCNWLERRLFRLPTATEVAVAMAVLAEDWRLQFAAFIDFFLSLLFSSGFLRRHSSLSSCVVLCAVLPTDQTIR